MIEAFINTLEFFPRGLVYVALGLLVLVLAKFSKDLMTRYRIDQEIVQKRNLAAAVGLSGYFLAVVLVFVGAVYQPFSLVANDGLGFNRAFGEDVLRVGSEHRDEPGLFRRGIGLDEHDPAHGDRVALLPSL